MASTTPDRLLMIYNAEDGLFNAINDWAHKFFTPSTYECHLCRFTYGMTGMLQPWKKFIESQPFPTEFLYRPFFRKAHPDYQDVALPLILTEKNGVLDVLLLADEIKEAGELDGLIALVRARLETWQPPAAKVPTA
jgi:hypothetical protein